MADQPKPNFTRLQLMQGQTCIVINGGGRSMKINGIDLTSTDPSWLPFLPIKASQIPIPGPQKKKKKKEEGSKCRKPQPQKRRKREKKTLKSLRRETKRGVQREKKQEQKSNKRYIIQRKAQERCGRVEKKDEGQALCWHSSSSALSLKVLLDAGRKIFIINNFHFFTLRLCTSLTFCSMRFI